MLNPEVIAKFGEDSKEFFTVLSEQLDDVLRDKCYTISKMRISSGRLHTPYFMGVFTDNDDVFYEVQNKCTDISLDMYGDDYKEEPIVGCLMCTEDMIKKEGIKVWI